MSVSLPVEDEVLRAARAALQRFKNAGSPLDPDNQEHLEAYLMVKRVNARPRANQILQTLASRTESTSSGATISTPFWIATEDTWTGGVQAALKKYSWIRTTYRPDSRSRRTP